LPRMRPCVENTRKLSQEQGQDENRLLLMQDEVGSRAREHLRAAAALHHKESRTMGAAHDIMPWGNVRGHELLKRTEHANRVGIAGVIRQCKDYFAPAMDEIQRALEAEGIAVTE